MGVCLAALFALVTAAPSALAKAGDLDPSFGKGGKVIRAANSGNGRWESVRIDVAQLPGGGVVVLAGEKLYGFKADGSPSPFGTVKVADPNGGKLQLADVTTDSLSRVLVVGGTRVAGGENDHVFVARYTPRGGPDLSFGNGGFIVTDFGLAGPRVPDDSPTQPPASVKVTGIAIDPSGRVVLTGDRVRAVGPCRGTSNLTYHTAFVARLDANGRRDPSFGDAGVVSLAGGPESPATQDLNPPVVDGNGKIYLSTRPTGPCDEGYAALVGHLDDSGHADPSFGDGGWVRVSGGAPGSFLPSSVTLDSRDRLLLLASGTQGSAIVKRLLPSGLLDRRFGRRGIATMSSQTATSQLHLAVDGAGRVWIAGASGPSFSVGRLTPQGRIDRGFGKSGRVTTSFGARSSAQASSITIDTRGRAVLAGTVLTPRVQGGDGLVLARYLGGR